MRILPTFKNILTFTKYFYGMYYSWENIPNKTYTDKELREAVFTKITAKYSYFNKLKYTHFIPRRPIYFYLKLYFLT